MLLVHQLNLTSETKIMAKAKTQSSPIKREKKKVTRKGIHAKTKQSNNKGSKNYKKPNVGQG